MPVISRRQGIKLAAATAVGAMPLSVALGAEAVRAPAVIRKRVLRFAHVTDVHVQPERGAGDGLIACLHHLQSLKDPPQLILNGGDAVMDVFAVGPERAAMLSELWKRTLKAECSIPIEHCIGNHDIWGWDPNSAATGNEPNWGKQWALDLYALPKPYRSFDRAGWHFIVLDSVQRLERSYIAKLDDAQFDWLEGDLAKVTPTTPILILSHVPILSVAAFMDGYNEKSGDWLIPGQWVHIDARRIKTLLHDHPNVKLCLSGHLHLVDRCEYAGVTYVCGGAVCGNWWKGPYQETPEGYTLVDLYADGTFDVQYVAYGWKPPRQAPLDP